MFRRAVEMSSRLLAASPLAADSEMSGGEEAVVPGLAPGIWIFSVEHSDGRTRNGSATVSPGGTNEVSLP